MSALRSPVSGSALASDTPHSLACQAERWPVLDGIPYLRTGREALVARALALLDRGERDAALALLLADQDDWWNGPPADPDRLQVLVREAGRLSLREAMDHLGFGRVGDYFAHRWSDPTYLAGICLVEAHRPWPLDGEAVPVQAFELACGIGHHLRALQRRGIGVSGGDVVWAKLWLARHWVLEGEPLLICFDAAAPHWPVDEGRFNLVLCHDAFYFLEPKPAILARLRAMLAPDGWLAVGHVHNRERPGFSAGAAVTADEIAALFPDGVVYDDAELTRALAEARAPVPASPDRLRDVEAFSVVAGPGFKREPRPVRDGLALPPPGTPLRRNPLYADGEGDPTIRWPSDRYAEEYGPLATYPARSNAPEQAVSGSVAEALIRRRELVDLPERW